MAAAASWTLVAGGRLDRCLSCLAIDPALLNIKPPSCVAEALQAVTGAGFGTIDVPRGLELLRADHSASAPVFLARLIMTPTVMGIMHPWGRDEEVGAFFTEQAAALQEAQLLYIEAHRRGLEAISELGDPYALCAHALLLLEEQCDLSSIRSDHARDDLGVARHLLERAARRGLAHASHSLAELLAETDLASAVGHYEEAAAQGHAPAQLALADIFRTGGRHAHRGVGGGGERPAVVPRSSGRALELLRR